MRPYVPHVRYLAPYPCERCLTIQIGSTPSAPTKNNITTSSSGGGSITAGWRETIRSLLERAVSDWSVKSLFRLASTPNTAGKDPLKQKPPGQCSEEESSSDSMPEASPREVVLTKTAEGIKTPAMKAIDRLAMAAVGHGSSPGSRGEMQDGSRKSGHLGNTPDVRRNIPVSSRC